MEKIVRVNAFQAKEEIIPIGAYRAGKETAQEATWECLVCGLILPYHVRTGPSKGRWIRNKCACQLEEARLKEIDEINEMRQRNFITKTFAWLGSEYADLALVHKTFENFDRQ